MFLGGEALAVLPVAVFLLPFLPDTKPNTPPIASANASPRPRAITAIAEPSTASASGVARTRRAIPPGGA